MKIFILRGLPGAGKSTLAQALSANSKSSVICEADDFFINEDGKYIFDPTKIEQAHQFCFKKFTDAINNEVETIIVSNTFTQFWEFKSYMNVAKLKGIKTTILVVENYHGGRSVHDVPEETLTKMEKRFTTKLK